MLARAWRWLGSALLLGGLLGAARPVPVEAACAFQTATEGMVVAVLLDGDPGVRVHVDWGDGTATTSAPTPPTSGRARLLHRYGSPGTYPIDVSATANSGIGCGTRLEVDVPNDEPADAAASAVVRPPPDADEAGEAETAEVPVAPTATPAGSGGGPSGGQGILGFLEGLFGRR